MNTFSQTTWNVPNVIGHSIDPYTKKIDCTEGFGAFDSILKNYYLGSRCIDIGGGKYDYNSCYCDYNYLFNLYVLDPFMRSKEHNKNILDLAEKRPFDSCVSISVLNVIDSKDSRHEHIKLCKKVVKEYGKVFFKVWSGDRSGIGKIKKDSFQSNCDITSYLEEIQHVFGRKNVIIDKDNDVIVAFK